MADESHKYSRGVTCNVDGERYSIRCPADVPVSWIVSELIRQHAARKSLEETHIVGLRNTRCVSFVEIVRTHRSHGHLNRTGRSLKFEEECVSALGFGPNGTSDEILAIMHPAARKSQDETQTQNAFLEEHILILRGEIDDLEVKEKASTKRAETAESRLKDLKEEVSEKNDALLQSEVTAKVPHYSAAIL